MSAEGTVSGGRRVPEDGGGRSAPRAPDARAGRDRQSVSDTEGVRAREAGLEPDWLVRLVLDRRSPLPLARQLYLALYTAVTRGEAPRGTALPPSRALASRLGVSRNTVVAAYAQLSDEGLVSGAGRGGTVVAHAAPGSGAAPPPDGLGSPPTSSAWPLSGRAGRLASDRARPLALAPGEPDAALFPVAPWQRAMARAARLPSAELGYRSDVSTRLQAGIARHLALYRSLVVDPERIVVTSGTRQSLLLAAALFADAGDVAWAEAPGYLGAVDAFRLQGLDVRACPVDADGAVPRSADPAPRLVYLTPAFQFPLGMPLSASRRDAFLALSAAHGTVLVEDDYDSEFRDDVQPRPALAAAASGAGARVLHAGTFSKLVFPAARVAWLVVPRERAETARRMLTALGGGHGTLARSAVADLLDEGVVARHLQRARSVYARRRTVLQELVARSGRVRLAGGGGLCAVLALARSVPLAALEAALGRAAVGAVPLERHDWSRPPGRSCAHLVVGLGNVDSLTLPGTFARLERALREAGGSAVPVGSGERAGGSAAESAAGSAGRGTG